MRLSVRGMSIKQTAAERSNSSNDIDDIMKFQAGLLRETSCKKSHNLMYKLNNMEISETGGIYILRSPEIHAFILMEVAPSELESYRVRSSDLTVEIQNPINFEKIKGSLTGIARVVYYQNGQVFKIEEGLFSQGLKNGKCRVIDT